MAEQSQCCDAYAADGGLDPQPFSTGNEYELETPSMPPGNYVVHAKVVVGNRASDDDQEFLCSLRHGQTGNIGIDTAGARLHGGAPWKAGSNATIALSGTVTFTVQDKVRLVCGTTSSDAYAQWAQLNAVEVGSITS
jgi:hypothetical protein